MNFVRFSIVDIKPIPKVERKLNNCKVVTACSSILHKHSITYSITTNILNTIILFKFFFPIEGSSGQTSRRIIGWLAVTVDTHNTSGITNAFLAFGEWGGRRRWSGWGMNPRYLYSLGELQRKRCFIPFFEKPLYHSVRVSPFVHKRDSPTVS